MKQTPIRKVSTKKAQQKRLEDKVRSELLERCEGHCMDCGRWQGLAGVSTSPQDIPEPRWYY